MKVYTIEFLRDEIARIIANSISMRRSSEATFSDRKTIESSYPPTEDEIDDFIFQCPFEHETLTDLFISALDNPANFQVFLTDEEFIQFQEDVKEWSSTNTWLGADDYHNIVVISDNDAKPFLDLNLERQIRYSQDQLQNVSLQSAIAVLSPSFRILQQILSKNLQIDDLHWRDFEILVAELLEADGYTVELGSGTKDGGKDIIAVKDLGATGFFKSVWQAKKKNKGNKVGISTIRELADVRQENKASKGIIVTTSFLTLGALERVRQDQYLLGKVERDDLLRWIDKLASGRRS